MAEQGALPELTDEEIKRFFEDAPLYVEYDFAPTYRSKYGIFTERIESYCAVCKAERPFGRTHITQTNLKALDSGLSSRSFGCLGCDASSRLFELHHKVDLKRIRLQKYGEFPRQTLPRSSALQKFFKDDADLYEKAVVSLANGYGIAASAYFRRIVENNIERLVALVEEDAKASGDSVAAEALAQLHVNSPMKDRIEIANKAVPGYLRPNGLNPLGKLYAALSGGVHALSDAECLGQAGGISKCLDYLVSELATRGRHRADFVKTVGGL